MADAQSIRILSMEDDPGLSRLLQKCLQRKGYIVDIAVNGDEGMAMLEKSDYDVVLLDNNMPFRGGIDVIRSLSSKGAFPPTIMVTGEGNEEVAVEALKLGAADYVVKDVHMKYLELLPAVIDDVLSKQRLVRERLQMIETLHRAQKLESLGVLAGGLAHDFNNLMTAILGNISLAKLNARPGDAVSQRLDEAEKACLRAQDLTQQLLTFSRGGAPIKKTVSFADLVRDSAGFALRGSRTRCEFRIPDDLWPIEADEGQISQVVSNLIINADQSMQEGGTITVKCENMIIGPNEAPPHGEGKYVKMSVQDHGIGIPKEHFKKIFDPYFTTKQKGSGLGLATSYSIIKRHDGLITLDSELGRGTTFFIYIPASERQAGMQERQSATPEYGSGRILIMDDEDMIREVAGKMLKKVGYDVECAQDGGEAIALYTKALESGGRFDVVLMDITIPGGMGGKEAIGKLLEIDPKVKAIVSSGYSNDPIMAEFKTYGFSGVVSKPYTIRKLTEIVKKTLSGR